MKNIAILSFVLALVVAGVANSATTTVTYQVSASGDDGFAQSAAVQDTTSAFLKIGDERTYAVPYQMSGMRFNNVNIPRSATITSAYLKISSINTDYRGQIYGAIAAEASDNPADFSGRMIGDAVLTAASVVWDYKTAWSPDTQYISPDISNAIQEVVNRPGFGSGNSIAIYYSTRDLSGKARSFASYEYSPASVAVLEITYEVFSISGTVATAGGEPIAGASITTDGNIEDTVTDQAGFYELLVPPGWSGNVSAVKSGYKITPSSIEYDNVISDQSERNYSAFQPTISGAVASYGYPLEGVTLTASNGGGTAVTDSAGSYNLTVPYEWSGTITPSKPQYTFTPVNKVYSNVIADTTSQNYTAILPPVSISGYVRDGSGNGVADVNVTADNGGGSVFTNTSGYYSITVPYNWSGTVTAKKFKWQITPASYTYNNLTSDQTNQNFSATYTGIIIVKADGTGDFATIQAAIDAAANGDVVILQAGTFTGNGNRDIDFLGKAITVRGATGDANDCIIDCNGTQAEPHRGFKFISGEDANSVLEGLKITHGYSFAGGGINCHGSGPTINSCIISNNTAGQNGGGIYNNDSDPIIDNCSIINNSSLGYGGGIYNYSSSSPTIINCTISNNSANLHGGGIYNNDSGPIIDNCIVVENSAHWGGGIYNYFGNPTISHCAVKHNSAAFPGGGFYNYLSNAIIYNCTISYNSAGSGGGFYNYGGDLIISNCIISYNLADYGSGFYHSYCDPIIKGCVISNNSATSYGGGVYSSASSPTISSCIIWGNSPPQINGTAVVTYSDIQGGSAGVGNININPLFVDEYHISPASPCFDAGDPNYIPDINETDIDGDPRVVGRIDMGADEVYSSTSALIVIMPGMVNFTAEGLNSASQSQNVSIKNYGVGILDWQILEQNCNWLSVFPATGQVNTGESNDVEVSVNPNIAGYGIYSCQLQVTAPEAENSPQTVTVNLEVLRPELFIIDSVFNFTAAGIDSNTAPQFLTIQNTGYDNLNWHIEMPSNCDWPKASPLAGQAGHLETDEVILSIDHNNINYGVYSCQFSVAAPDAQNSPQVVTVNLEVLGPQIGVNRDYFCFTAYGKSDTSVAGQELVITNTGFDTLNWHIEVLDCNWLGITPQSGQVTDGNSIVALTVDPNKAPAYGYNYATINIIDENTSNSPLAVTARLLVLGPSMYVNPPRGLYIYAESNTVVEDAFEISNTGYDILHWNIEIPEPQDCNWLETIEPLSGECARGESDIVTATIDTSGLENNDYHAELLIHSPEGHSEVYFLHLIVYTPNEIHVPRDYPTIQAAINAAVDGDEVIVEPGTYTGEGNRDIDFLGKAITVRSENGPENCIIDIRASQTDWHNGFCFRNGENKSAVVEGFTITGGYTYQGGGVFCGMSSPTIKNCIITKNISGWGGGIAVEKSNASIVNCLISENEAWDCAGGIFNDYYSNITIANCTITANRSQWVGGILCYESNANVDNCILWANTSPDGKEFGLRSWQDRTVPLFTLSYSNILGGESSGDVDPTSALNWGPGNIDVDPCFAEAGFWHPNDTPLDANDDFWVQGDYHLKSQAGRWKPSIYIGLDPTGDGFIDLSDFAALANFWCEKGGSLPADLDNSGSVDFVDLSLLLDDYLTNYSSGAWVFDDVNSPCIDAGDPVSDWTAELWPHGKRINMGAYGGTPQASMSLLTVGNKADLNNDGFVNAEDLALFVEMWLTKEVLLSEDINRNGLVNSPDFAEFAGQWLWEE